jgi:L-tartrate/succinate antiporter
MMPASAGPEPVAERTGKPLKRRFPWGAVVPLALGIAIALLPVPRGLSVRAWYYFALFAAVIVSLVLEPLPAAALGLIGVAAAAVLQLPFKPEQLATRGFDAPAEAIKWALSGFSNTTVWLIFAAFMFALGYERTGLGKRIALSLVKRLGRRTLGLGYAVAFADLILAPFTPSNSARSAGTIYPVIGNIPALYGSKPGDTSRRIGSYLMWTAFSVTCVTSSMFLTSLAPNPLAAELVRKAVGVQISWTEWAVGFLPVGVLLVAILPALVYVLYPPTVKKSPEVASWAGEQLAQLGRVSRHEIGMALLAVLALCFWIFGRALVDATSVAIAVVALMVVCRIVTWEDVLANKQAWNILVWFATLVTLAEGLNRVGFITWFTRSASSALAGLPPTVIMLALVGVFFFVHYLFASLTAHTTAVLPVVLAAGAAVPGIPIAKFAMLLCYSLGIMGVMTPYATGPAPVYFGSGYVSRKDFWRLGFLFGVIFFGVMIAIEIPYLR